MITHADTPHDALIKALENVEIMESVLILYEGKPGTQTGSYDSNLTIEKCLYLIELFKTWLIGYCLGFGRD